MTTSSSLNAQFGIYVQDGFDHQVYDNTAFLNGTGDDDNIKIQGLTIPPPAQTYYVDCGVNGDDTRTPIQAKDPAFPWKTITKGVVHAQAGSTILVSPGTCPESVESKRDGTKAARILLKSMVPGGAIIQPPAGTNGFVISHNYHTIDGFKVTGAFQGLKLGPHENRGRAGEGPRHPEQPDQQQYEQWHRRHQRRQGRDRVQHAKEQRHRDAGTDRQRDQLLGQLEPDP